MQVYRLGPALQFRGPIHNKTTQNKSLLTVIPVKLSHHATLPLYQQGIKVDQTLRGF